MLVAPSILSADFGNLAKEVQSICEAGCDYIHIDVMDGHFVPNLTLGSPVISAVQKVATKPLDIHLMVQNSPFFLELFAPFAPEFISFHIEEEKHLHRLIQQTRNRGIRPAIALNPHTSEETLAYILEDIDMVLVMSVNPGFGGQKFIPSALRKIKRLKELIERRNPACLIEVDGGVSNQNIAALREAGVDIAVAGSYIFGANDYESAIKSLKQ
ncbi:MAG: ribulose-phosphate 3-epimerase [Wolinella sp.]